MIGNNLKKIDKNLIVQQIMERLSYDLDVFFTAAKTAHAAATHEENLPDNKYDTLALEASYIAQGQANRAQELRQSIEIYKQLPTEVSGDVIGVTSLVTIEDDNGTVKVVFIGPVEGGLKFTFEQTDITVITPASPLGRELLGKYVGETVVTGYGTHRAEYEIVAVK